MDYKFVELVDSLVVKEPESLSPKASTLVITKLGQYLRGHIVDHNVRVNADGKVRGRLVLKIGESKKDVDANDVMSLEKQG